MPSDNIKKSKPQKQTTKTKSNKPTNKKQSVVSLPKVSVDVSEYRKFLIGYSDMIQAKQSLTVATNVFNGISAELNTNAHYPTSLTDHAFHQIIDRLEDLSLQYVVVHDFVMAGKVADSIFLPSNLREFVFDNVLRSIDTNGVKSKKSRSGGTETIFNTHMSEWDIGAKEITFSCIAENGVIKTGYFNVHDK